MGPRFEPLRGHSCAILVHQSLLTVCETKFSVVGVEFFAKRVWVPLAVIASYFAEAINFVVRQQSDLVSEHDCIDAA